MYNSSNTTLYHSLKGFVFSFYMMEPKHTDHLPDTKEAWELADWLQKMRPFLAQMDETIECQSANTIVPSRNILSTCSLWCDILFDCL